MKTWFGSDPNGTVLCASSKPEVHGTFSVTFRNSDDAEYTCSGEYQEVSPLEKLRFTWYWKGREDHVELVSLQFSKLKSGVRMKFTHERIDAQTTHDYRTGWTSTFEKLRKTIFFEQKR